MDRSQHYLLFLDGLSKYKELKHKCCDLKNAKSKILKPADDNFNQIVCTSHISCNESVRAFVAKVIILLIFIRTMESDEIYCMI